MIDNRITELQSLSKLKIAGRLHYWRGTIEIPEIELISICDEIQAEHESAIAATLGSGTCEIVATSTNNLMYPDYMVKWYELSCGHSFTLNGEDEPKWCAVCGKKVKQ